MKDSGPNSCKTHLRPILLIKIVAFLGAYVLYRHILIGFSPSNDNDLWEKNTEFFIDSLIYFHNYSLNYKYHKGTTLPVKILYKSLKKWTFDTDTQNIQKERTLWNTPQFLRYKHYSTNLATFSVHNIQQPLVWNGLFKKLYNTTSKYFND